MLRSKMKGNNRNNNKNNNDDDDNEGVVEEEIVVDDDDDDDDDEEEDDEEVNIVDQEDGDCDDDNGDEVIVDVHYSEEGDSPIVVVTCPEEDEERTTVRRGSAKTKSTSTTNTTNTTTTNLAAGIQQQQQPPPPPPPPNEAPLQQHHLRYTSVAADIIDRRQRAAAARAAAAAMLQRYDLDRIVAAERSLILERYLQQRDQRSFHRHAISLRLAQQQQQQQQQRLRAEGILRQSNNTNDRGAPNSTAASSYLSPSSRAAAHSLLKQQQPQPPQPSLIRRSPLMDRNNTPEALRNHARQSERFRKVESVNRPSHYQDIIEIESSSEEEEIDDSKNSNIQAQKESPILVDQDEDGDEMEDDENEVVDDSTVKYHQLALMALNAKYTDAQMLTEEINPENVKRKMAEAKERERKTLPPPTTKEKESQAEKRTKHERQKEDQKTTEEKEKRMTTTTYERNNKKENTNNDNGGKQKELGSKKVRYPNNNNNFQKESKDNSNKTKTTLTIAEKVNLSRKQTKHFLTETGKQTQSLMEPSKLPTQENRDSENKVTNQNQTKEIRDQDGNEKESKEESQATERQKPSASNNTPSKQVSLKLSDQGMKSPANTNIAMCPRMYTQNHISLQNGNHARSQALPVSLEANKLVVAVAAAANKCGNATQSPAMMTSENNNTPIAILPRQPGMMGPQNSNETNLSFFKGDARFHERNNSPHVTMVPNPSTNVPTNTNGLATDRSSSSEPMTMPININKNNHPNPHQPILDMNLAGPFVHGIITNNIHMLQNLDGIAGQLADVHDIILHQTISKLLMKFTMGEPSYNFQTNKRSNIPDRKSDEGENKRYKHNTNGDDSDTTDKEISEDEKNNTTMETNISSDGENRKNTEADKNTERSKESVTTKDIGSKKRKRQQVENLKQPDHMQLSINNGDAFLDGIDLKLSVTAGDIEEIAEEFTAERRKCIRQSVQIAFLEMKQRHDVIVSRNSHGSINAAVENLEKVKRERTLEEANHSQNLLQIKKMFQYEIKQLQQQHEDFVENLIQEHRKEIATLQDEIKQAKLDHKNGLGSYLKASCHALRTLRESTEPARII